TVRVGHAVEDAPHGERDGPDQDDEVWPRHERPELRPDGGRGRPHGLLLHETPLTTAAQRLTHGVGAGCRQRATWARRWRSDSSRSASQPSGWTTAYQALSGWVP